MDSQLGFFRFRNLLGHLDLIKQNHFKTILKIKQARKDKSGGVNPE